MSISNKLIKSRQQRIQHYAHNSDAYRFFNLLTSPELFTKVDDLLPEHRDQLRGTEDLFFDQPSLLESLANH